MAGAPQTPDAPLFAGSILGLRAWNVVQVGQGRGSRLAAAYVESLWVAGDWTEARCNAEAQAHEHEAPEAICSCGLYGYHPRIETAYELHFGHADGIPPSWPQHAGVAPASVYGVVEAAGRIEVHADGFRAERCRPLALVCASDWPPARRLHIERLAARHGAEILEVEAAEEVVRWCERRGGVLDASTVHELLADVADRPPRPPGRPPATPRPPATGWARVHAIASRIAEIALLAVAALFSIVWYGGLIAFGVAMAGGLLFGWFDEEPAPRPAHVAKAWVKRDDCAVRVAIRARRDVKRLVVRVGGRDGEGAGLGHFQRDVGPLERGRNALTLAHVRRGLCRNGEELSLRVRIVWRDRLGGITELRSVPSGNARSGRPPRHEPSRTLPNHHRRARRAAGHGPRSRARARPGAEPGARAGDS